MVGSKGSLLNGHASLEGLLGTAEVANLQQYDSEVVKCPADLRVVRPIDRRRNGHGPLKVLMSYIELRPMPQVDPHASQEPEDGI
jgi:hypothetical protein